MESMGNENPTIQPLGRVRFTVVFISVGQFLCKMSYVLSISSLVLMNRLLIL